MSASINPILIVSLSSFFAAFGGLLLKKGSKNFKISLLMIKNYYILLGGIIYVLAAGVFVYALNFGELTVLFPLTASTYIWTSILSAIFLKDNINLYKIGGILLIILGAIMIVR